MTDAREQELEREVERQRALVQYFQSRYLVALRELIVSNRALAKKAARIKRMRGGGDGAIKRDARVMQAAIDAVLCPPHGGYNDGPSVEDVYEELEAAVLTYIKATDLDVHELGWWTLENARKFANDSLLERGRDLKAVE